MDVNDTDTVWIGNLPAELNEHDLLIMFSQFGVPIKVVLSRDPTTGESKRFAFLQYEDKRSSVLAVDNFNGYCIKPGEKIRVSMTEYKPRRDRRPGDADVEWEKAVEELMREDLVQ